MKNKFACIAVAGLVTFAACNDGTTETSTIDSSSMTTTMDAPANNTGTDDMSVNASFDENSSYMSLQDNKPVKVKKDPSTQRLVNSETNEPMNYFFYNPSSRDTFDMRGNVVNNYLIRGNDGMYTLDENRWRMKVDEDGDVKFKNGDESKIKIDASSGQTKIKTADTTIKR